MGPSLMREYIVIDNSPKKLHSHFLVLGGCQVGEDLGYVQEAIRFVW